LHSFLHDALPIWSPARPLSGARDVGAGGIARQRARPARFRTAAQERLRPGGREAAQVETAGRVDSGKKEGAAPPVKKGSPAPKGKEKTIRTTVERTFSGYVPSSSLRCKWIHQQ